MSSLVSARGSEACYDGGVDFTGAESNSEEKTLLNLQIDNKELEEQLLKQFGGDTESIARAFLEFLREERIREDIGVSVSQLEAGEGVPLRAVMQEIRAKYE